jgi:hypothetical protein
VACRVPDSSLTALPRATWIPGLPRSTVVIRGSAATITI